MQFKYSVLTASLVALMSLSGCNSEDPGDDFVATGGVVVTTMDGYLKNALVCTDLNENGLCDPGETLGLTDQNGTLEMTVSMEKQAQMMAYPIVVKILQPQTSDPRSYIDAGIYTAIKIQQPMSTRSRFNIDEGIYTVDMDQPYQAMAKDVVYRAPAGITLVSPLTDLVVAQMQNGYSQAAAEQKITEQLNKLVEGDADTTVDLYADYIETQESTVSSDAEKRLAAKLHKTAQILTETQHNTTASEHVLDSAVAQIVDAAVTAVNGASDTELDNPNFKPIVPVSQGGVVTAAVSNYQAVVDKTVLDGIVTELDAQRFKTELGINFTSQHLITGLFTDKDQTVSPAVSINNTAQLKAENLTVSLVNDRLVIEDIKDAQGKSQVKSGDYYIEFIADDLDSNDVKIGTVKTLIRLEIAENSSEPSVNEDAQKRLQSEIQMLDLQAKVSMQSDPIDMSELFIDLDGDILTLSAQDGNTGLQYQFNDKMLTVSGTPLAAGDYVFTVIATDDDQHRAIVSFNLPTIAAAPAGNNNLAALLEGKILYRFSAKWELANDLPGSDKHHHIKLSCGAIQLSSDHQLLEAEGEAGQCPAESDAFAASGSWQVEGDNIRINLDGEGSELLSLHEDRSSDAALPRVHLISMSVKEGISQSSSGAVTIAANADTEPMTFYIGEQAAQSYWQQQASNTVVAGNLITADADTKSPLVNQDEPYDQLDVDLFFNVSCETLGFELDGYGDLSYRWTEKVPYDFYLLNAKFSHGKFMADNTQPGFAFSNSAQTECGIDFDYRGGVDFAPGESVVVLANPREGHSAEEFMINTVVDRKMADSD